MQKTITIEINEYSEYRKIECDLDIWDVLDEVNYEINSFFEFPSQLDIEDISPKNMIIIEKQIDKYLAENTESLIDEINEHAKSQHEDLEFRIKHEG